MFSGGIFGILIVSGLCGDWLGDVCCVGGFPDKGKNDDVLNIPEWQVPGKIRNGESVLVTKIILQVDFADKSLQIMTFSDAQEVARLVYRE